MLLCFYTGFPFWSSLFFCPFNSLIYKFYVASSFYFSHLLFLNFHNLTVKAKTPIFLQNNSPSILVSSEHGVFLRPPLCTRTLRYYSALTRDGVAQAGHVLLNDGATFEKFIIKWVCRCANITECTHQPRCTAYYTPRLHGVACCSHASVNKPVQRASVQNSMRLN